MKISKYIFPRPVALITSCDESGNPDVATFSFIMPVSFEPKYVAFSVSPDRYTFDNVRKVKEFVLNMPSEGMLDKIWICGTKSGREVNKFELGKLEGIRADKVKPPRIRGCPVQLECRVELVQEFGDHYLVVGKAVEEHIEGLDFNPILHYSGEEFYRMGGKISLEDSQ